VAQHELHGVTGIAVRKVTDPGGETDGQPRADLWVFHRSAVFIGARPFEEIDELLLSWPSESCPTLPQSCVLTSAATARRVPDVT
jgi:hypothetical protein